MTHSSKLAFYEKMSEQLLSSYTYICQNNFAHFLEAKFSLFLQIFCSLVSGEYTHQEGEGLRAQKRTTVQEAEEIRWRREKKDRGKGREEEEGGEEEMGE